jgi:CHAD domain-containing protein
MNIDKWLLEGTDENISFVEAAKLTLQNRFDNLLKQIQVYLVQLTDEDLHQVRIAIRRVRYSLEVFASCFDSKDFKRFYDKIEALQDITGRGRDLDIMIIYFNNKYQSNRKPLIMKKIILEKQDIIQQIKNKLLEFIHSKNLKKFSKLITK